MNNKYYGPNLFEEKSIEEVIERTNKLNPNSPAQWGKMSVDKMLAHCAETFEVALGHKKVKRGFLSYTIGPLVKFIFTNKSPFAKSAPTAKEFIITDEKDFNKEQERLIKLINEFYQGGPEKVTKNAHAFFGKLSPAQWARGMYKHMDHHLRQFGA